MAEKPGTGTDDLDVRLGRIAALGDPVRRALYRYVVAQPEPVGRIEAAKAVGVPHHGAKFHLDRLEADGLLDVEYARPPGRRGPGAGRPAKRYRRSEHEMQVSLPERRYDLAGRVMAEAISAATSSRLPIDRAVRDAADAAGRALGEQIQTGRRGGEASRRRAVTELLARCGYEPRDENGMIILANCPFHRLAQDHPDLVCGMNLHLLEGLTATGGGAGLHAQLDPAPSRCCVTLSPAGESQRQPTRRAGTRSGQRAR